jgi:hypothetical protein
MIYYLSKVREDLIEDVIGKVKENFDKSYKDKLTNLFNKCPQFGISDPEILLKLTSEYFLIINTYLHNIFENMIKLQSELNISYNNKEIDFIRKSITKFTDASNEKFLLFIVCEQISYKTHTKELDLEFINKIENNTSISIKQELHHLTMVIAQKNNNLEIIYRKRVYKLSMLSIGLSVIAIGISIITFLIIILKYK